MRGKGLCFSLLMRCTDSIPWNPNPVDIFNATSGLWTTAAFSVARTNVVATSLPNDGLAIFAGGDGESYVLILEIARGWCVFGEGGYFCVGRVAPLLVPLPLLPLPLFLLPLIADALRRCKWQCCERRHLQCDEWFVDHCCP